MSEDDKITDGSWAPTDPRWAYHYDPRTVYTSPDGVALSSMTADDSGTPRSITMQVIGDRPLELRNLHLLGRTTVHGGTRPGFGQGWDRYPTIGEHTVTEAQIERGWIDVADPTA